MTPGKTMRQVHWRTDLSSTDKCWNCSGRSRNSFTHRASSGTTPSISQDIPCWRKRDKATCKRALENSNPACPFCFLIATVNVLPPFLQCLHKNQNQKVQLSSTLASLGKFSTRQERLKNRYTRPAALPDVLISSAHDEAKIFQIWSRRSRL